MRLISSKNYLLSRLIFACSSAHPDADSLPSRLGIASRFRAIRVQLVSVYVVEGAGDHISNQSISSDDHELDASTSRNSTSNLQLEASCGAPDNQSISSATTIAFSASAAGGSSPVVPHRDGGAQAHRQDLLSQPAPLNQHATADDKRRLTDGYINAGEQRHAAVLRPHDEPLGGQVGLAYRQAGPHSYIRPFKREK